MHTYRLHSIAKENEVQNLHQDSFDNVRSVETMEGRAWTRPGNRNGTVARQLHVDMTWKLDACLEQTRKKTATARYSMARQTKTAKEHRQTLKRLDPGRETPALRTQKVRTELEVNGQKC